MSTVSKHVIAELYHCKNIEYFDNEDNLRDLLIECAAIAKVSIIRVDTHKFYPKGISGSLFLEESHFSTHIWTEENYISLDLYTCGTTALPTKALQYFMERLGCEGSCVSVIERGLRNKEANSYFHVTHAYQPWLEEIASLS